MAGTGRAPKAPEQRRNHHDPRRGEWQRIFAPTKAPPKMPARGKGRGSWSTRTTKAWKSWWRDPASTMWTAADVDLVEHLADVFEEWVRDPRASVAAECRQLRDSLGLTPKGRQDRRWFVSSAPITDEEEPEPTGHTARPGSTARRARLELVKS